MIQRIQTLWMALTAALVGVVVAMPVIYFSAGGAEFRLMTYGVREVAGSVLVGGEGLLVTPVLSICLAVLLGLATLVPFAAIFFYKRRKVQIRLLGAEFILLLGAAGMTGYYVWMYRGLVAGLSDNFYFSFFPLLLVVAMLSNFFAVKGVTRDEIMVRAADRIR